MGAQQGKTEPASTTTDVEAVRIVQRWVRRRRMRQAWADLVVEIRQVLWRRSALQEDAARVLQRQFVRQKVARHDASVADFEAHHQALLQRASVYAQEDAHGWSWSFRVAMRSRLASKDTAPMYFRPPGPVRYTASCRSERSSAGTARVRF